ncbi:flagellar protein FlaG [Cupriavidus consociatus]|uniref:flagellar protein FlaG n=1 Tax=Cupriavidus consociatus TaxID=2821357 RepID=UPI001AE43A6D|nr:MULTISPECIES: flagellar protein FlaG [unclassified Cupriavidus]MBP0619895.1 flagellar protein FlaG [Cupriavidus sp. LEh25]MDK2656550.1 flagellar protein FlaG [Cupriavidus sp. LEh21]
MAPPPPVNPIALRLPADSLVAAMPSAGATPVATQATHRQQGAAGAPDEAALDEVEASAAIGELVHALKMTSIGLRFEIDETTHRVITKVVDKESGELIRQMPTEEVLRIARAIDKLQGLFVSQAA